MTAVFVILALLATATVSGLLYVSSRVEIDEEDDDSLPGNGIGRRHNQR